MIINYMNCNVTVLKEVTINKMVMTEEEELGKGILGQISINERTNPELQPLFYKLYFNTIEKMETVWSQIVADLANEVNPQVLMEPVPFVDGDGEKYFHTTHEPHTNIEFGKTQIIDNMQVLPGQKLCSDYCYIDFEGLVWHYNEILNYFQVS